MATDARLSAPVRSVDDLEATFHAGAKALDQWRIGVEYEKPVVDAASGDSVAYEGPRGIGSLLAGLRDRFPQWSAVMEGPNIVALEDGLSSITLEPGGQLEMSGQQCDSLHCAHEELQRHVGEIVEVGEALGLHFLGLGIVPKTPIERVPWMPKQRYRIMHRIMGRTGKLGRRMMAQTATVQCNFDYSGEADALRKMRVGLGLAPVLVAVSANSPVVDGSPTGYQSFRAHIWSDTDADRCGFLPFTFGTDALFRAYTEYALDVPMYFIHRDGAYREVDGIPFRRFMDGAIPGEQATLADWSLHLTTLFPEVRLKTYIEIRSADSQAVELMLGTPAMAKGILYDDDALGAAWDVVRRWCPAQLPALHEEAARHGLGARFAGVSLRDYAVELLDIARGGLERQARRNAQDRTESIHLDLLAEETKAGRNPASRIIERWTRDWGGNVDGLIESTRYRSSFVERP